MISTRVQQAVGVGPTDGPTIGLQISKFPNFFDFFSKEIFFKGKFFFSKVVHLTIKMISILTLSQKRKFQLFRDPNCGPNIFFFNREFSARNFVRVGSPPLLLQRIHWVFQNMEFFHSRFASSRDCVESDCIEFDRRSQNEYENFDVETVLETPRKRNFYDVLYSGYDDFIFEEQHNTVHSCVVSQSIVIRIVLFILAMLFPWNPNLNNPITSRFCENYWLKGGWVINRLSKINFDR